MPDPANDRPAVPLLRLRKGSEFRLSGPALIELMQAVLARGQSFRFCARGWSMSPFVRDGDVITVAPAQTRVAGPDGRGCGVGHIVAFISPVSQRLVVHRIVGRQESRFLIQGDNMQTSGADSVGRSDIIGRVVRIERGRRRVWLGLGPERFAIAILSRAGMLLPVLFRARVLTRLLRKRHGVGN